MLEEESTQEVISTNPEFQEALKNFRVEAINRALAEESVHALDTKLIVGENHVLAANINRKNLDYDSANFFHTEWGGVLIVRELGDNPSEIGIIYDEATSEIAGYGAFSIQGNEAAFTGRIFKKNIDSMKLRGVKPREVLKQRMWAHIALSDNSEVTTVTVPSHQLYRPDITGENSTALPAYWAMGFRSGLAQENGVLARISKGEKVPNDELIDLAKKASVKMDLTQYGISSAKSEIELDYVPTSSATTDLLRMANKKEAVGSSQTVSSANLGRLRDRLKSI